MFGAFLTASHFYAIALWNKNQFLISKLSPTNSEPICFPFFPNCNDFFNISDFSLQFFLYAYLLLTILGIFCFFQKKLLTLAYYIFFVLFIIKSSIHLSSYSFMGNYNYMASLVYFCYLFLPRKKLVIKYLIIAFYITAGALKLNSEWLTGATIPYPPPMLGNFLVPSLFYVVLLELVFVFGLLCKSRSIRLFSLAQFFIFHIFSLQVVGFFNPMIMLSILSIFVIDEYHYFRNTLKSSNHIHRFLTLNERPTVYLVLLIF